MSSQRDIPGNREVPPSSTPTTPSPATSSPDPPTTTHPSHSQDITQENLPFGDDIEFKTEGVYRHIGGNVNGISADNKFADATALSVQAKELQADGEPVMVRSRA